MSKLVITLDPENRHNRYYQVSVSMYIFLSYLFNSSITNIPMLWGNNSDTLLYMGLVLVGILLILKTLMYMDMQSLIKILLSLGLTAVLLYNSGTIYIPVIILFLMAGDNVNIDKIIRSDYITKIICVLLTLVLNYLGVIQGGTYYKNGTLLNSLGFKNINGLAAAIFEIGLMYLFINRHKIHRREVLIYIILVALNYYITRSRTPLYASAITLILVCLNLLLSTRVENLNEGLGRGIIIGVIIGISLLTFMLVFYLDFFEENGLIMSGRFHYIYALISRYKITLFGQIIETRAVMDFAYVFILIKYGIVGLMLFVGCYILGIRKAIMRNDFFSIIALFSFLIYGIGETTIVRLEYNFSVFLLIPVFWRYWVLKSSISEE